jgi:hypothetical protein
MEADPIQFKRENGVVTLTMSEVNYSSLLIFLGSAAASARSVEGSSMFWRIIRFCNAMNAGNPQYQPYEIPETHGTHK